MIMIYLEATSGAQQKNRPRILRVSQGSSHATSSCPELLEGGTLLRLKDSFQRQVHQAGTALVQLPLQNGEIAFHGTSCSERLWRGGHRMHGDA